MSLEKKFEKNGWFPILKKIDFETRDRFEKYIIKQEDDLKIFFNTSGGDVNVALSIVDLMNLWKKVEGKKVKSFCLGECSSAGLTILSSCDNEFRECAPNTRFLFHSHFYRVNLRHNLGLEANQQALLKQWQWFEKAIKQESDGFKLSDEKIMELRQFGENHSYSLNPNEAKELGIIAKITDMPSIL